METKNNIYFGNFNSKEEVAKEFDIKLDDSIKILFAEYVPGNWCGEAFVLFIKDRKLYEVNGDHCSCHELQGQWEPEETSFEAVRHYLEEGSKFEDYSGKDALKDIIDSRLK